MEEDSLHIISKRKNLFPKILAASLALVSQLPVNSYALSKNDSTKSKRKLSIINKADAKVAFPIGGSITFAGLVGLFLYKNLNHVSINVKQFLQKFKDLVNNKNTLIEITATYCVLKDKLRSSCKITEKFDEAIGSDEFNEQHKKIDKLEKSKKRYGLNLRRIDEYYGDAPFTEEEKEELCTAYENCLKLIIDKVKEKNFKFEEILMISNTEVESDIEEKKKSYTFHNFYCYPQ